MESPRSTRAQRSHSLSSLDSDVLGGGSAVFEQQNGFYTDSKEDFLVFDEVILSDRDTPDIETQFDRVAIPVVTERVPDNQSHVRRYLRAVHEPELEDYYYSKKKFRYNLHVFLFKLLSFVAITFTWTSLLVGSFSVGATVFCWHFELVTDLPLSLVVVGIIFPISFGIGHNFSRRETTIREVAVLKALSLSLYLGARDWPISSDRHLEVVKQIRDSLGVLLTVIRQTMLHNTPAGGSVQAYKAFDDLVSAFR